MVQRRVPNKLGTQGARVKSEKRLGNLKPTPFQHQDGRSRGSDMQKKMKRSRSIKLSGIESLESSPMRKTMPQPRKPPPLNPPAMTATPQKQQSVNKATDWSPNYMKATSSSEARKERCQVSSLNGLSGSGSKNLNNRSSSGSSKSSSSAAYGRSIKTLTKSSSLKLVRTLTKSPSFKPGRGITKKCARAALCADMTPQKATCSSTLKDSKFPAYLILNPGGTEAEGTSVMKVCPYTYCSLNGHHQTPLPPLKCFLKARRRSMKLHRSMKLEDLSPRRKRPDDGLLANSGEKRPHVDSALVKSAPVVQEAGMDFFIAIYTKSTEDGVENTGKSTDKDGAGLGATDFSSERKEQNDESSLDGDKEAEAEVDKDKLVSEIDPEEESKQYDNSIYMEMNITTDYDDGIAEVNREGFMNLVDDDGITEVSDMDWEEGQLSTSEVDADDDDVDHVDDVDDVDDVTCCSPENQSEIKLLDLQGKPEVVESDDIFSNCTEEISMDEVLLQELFEQETASSDDQSRNEGFSKEDYTPQNWTEDLESLTSDSTNDQFSTFEDTVDEIETEGEKDKEVEAAAASIKEPAFDLMELKVDETDTFKTDMQLGDGENDCVNDMIAEGLNGYQEDRCLQAVDATMWLQNQIATLQKPEEKDMSETEEDHNKEKQHRKLTESNTSDTEDIEVEACTNSDTEETLLETNDGTRGRSQGTFLRPKCSPNQEVAGICSNSKWTIRSKKPINDLEEESDLNWRDPNFLPILPEAEAEMVDLRHQEVDERKNADDWMLDHALQQAVAKLAPARKRKVALLVEAFETVLPIPKYEPRIKNISAAFSVTRSIQACS